jgi:hypothetical protein
MDRSRLRSISRFSFAFLILISARMPSSAPPASDTDSNAAIRRFALWAVEQLGLACDEDGQGRYWLTLPEEARAQFDDQPRLQFTFDQEIYAEHASDDLELVAPGGRLLSWLIQEVRQLGNVTHAAPADQPQSVPEITSRLFPAYRVEGGSVRLAGCTLEDRLVLRMTFRLRLEGLEPRDELFEVQIAGNGQPLDEAAAAQLGLQSLVRMERPPRIDESDFEWLIETGLELGDRRRTEAEERAMGELAARRAEEERQLSDYFAKTRADVAQGLAEELAAEERSAIEEQLASLDAQFERRLASLEERYAVHGKIELVATTLVWCKHAAGKLRFTVGQQGAELEFADWARTLAAPPLTCEHTGVATHHIAATDDGRITAAEQIDRCEVTGRRVLKQELRVCAVTGKRALAEYFTRCPVTSEELLTESLVVCSECRQGVSPHALEEGRCTACRTRQFVSKSDPRIARVLDEHAKLDAWRNWSLAETATVYNLTVAGLVKRLLVIIDKESLKVLHLATGSRFGSRWTSADPGRFEQVVT